MTSSLVALVGWPAVALGLEAARQWGDQGVGMASARPWTLAWETCKLVGLTEAIAIPSGLVLGWLLFRTDIWGRRGLLLLVLVVLFVPMPLVAVAWIGSFGNAGRLQAFGGLPILTGMRGAAFVHAMAAIPWVTLLAGVGLRSVEPELEESALLDAPAWWVAWKVTFRRSVGAILGAAVAVAVLTAGDMTVTDLLQVRTYAEEAYLQAQLGLGQGAAGLRATLPMVIVLGSGIAWCGWTLLRTDPARLPSAAARSKTWALGRWRVLAGWLLFLTLGNVVLVPIYGLIWRAGHVGRPPRWSLAGLVGSLQAAWPDLIAPTVLGSGLRSLDSRPLIGTVIWGAVAATATVTLAWSLAWKARESRFWRGVTVVVAALTLAAPGPVVGVALKRAYLMIPVIHDTPCILVFAYILRTLPYALLVLWPAVRLVPREFLDAAFLDGHGGWGVFWRVGLPLTRGGIVAAWGVGFVLAMGELPTANFVAPPGHFPVALEVWRLLHTGVESRLAALGLLLILMAAAVGVGAALLLRGEVRGDRRSR